MYLVHHSTVDHFLHNHRHGYSALVYFLSPWLFRFTLEKRVFSKKFIITVRQTMSSVWCAHSLGVELPRLDDLVQPRVARVSLDVHDVDPVRAEAGDDQSGPGHGRVVVAGAAGVPAGVVQLVPCVGHVEAGDDLGVSRTVGIHVNSRHIVRPVLGGNQAGKIDDLLASSRLKGMSRNEWKKYKSVFLFLFSDLGVA